MQDRFLKRLRKKARKGMRGWPAVTIDQGRASPGVRLLHGGRFARRRQAGRATWKTGDVRADAQIVQEILEYIEAHGALSVIMTDGIIGCPHQEGIDYEGPWCPQCDFWKGRDRFTREFIH